MSGTVAGAGHGPAYRYDRGDDGEAWAAQMQVASPYAYVASGNAGPSSRPIPANYNAQTTGVAAELSPNIDHYVTVEPHQRQAVDPDVIEHLRQDLLILLQVSPTFRNLIYAATRETTEPLKLKLDPRGDISYYGRYDPVSNTHVISLSDLWGGDLLFGVLLGVGRAAHDADFKANRSRYLAGKYDQAPGGALASAVDDRLRIDFQSLREQAQITREAGEAVDGLGPLMERLQAFGQTEEDPARWSFRDFKASEFSDARATSARSHLTTKAKENLERQDGVQKAITSLQGRIDGLASGGTENDPGDLQHRLDRLGTKAGRVQYSDVMGAMVDQQLGSMQDELAGLQQNDILAGADELLESVGVVIGEPSEASADWRAGLAQLGTMVSQTRSYTPEQLTSIYDEINLIQGAIEARTDLGSIPGRMSSLFYVLGHPGAVSSTQVGIIDAYQGNIASIAGHLLQGMNDAANHRLSTPPTTWLDELDEIKSLIDRTNAYTPEQRASIGSQLDKLRNAVRHSIEIGSAIRNGTAVERHVGVDVPFDRLPRATIASALRGSMRDLFHLLRHPGAA